MGIQLKAHAQGYMPKLLWKGDILFLTLRLMYDTINVISRRESMTMPITSKKQSQAKQDWNKENRKVFGVCVMKKTEEDIWNYLQGKEASTIFKKALREYMENHKDEVSE